jgi:hypothetical protein
MDMSAAESEEAIRRNREWRERHDAQARRAGAAVVSAVAAGAWDTAGVEERLGLLERAFTTMFPLIGLVRFVQLAVSLTLDEHGRVAAGLDEGSGVLVFPLEWVRSATWEQAVGVIAHELRHGWQLDLLEGAVEDELSDWVVPAWRADVERYDAANPAMYGSSLLEQDADGFREAFVESLR